MTVPAPGSLTYAYSEDGVTTVFPYPVRFIEAQELVVMRTVDGIATTLTMGVDYTVSGEGSPAGGSITRTAATNGGTITIYRDTTWKQLVDLEDKQRNPAQAVEDQLDRLTMAGQDTRNRVGVIEGKTSDIDEAVARAEAAKAEAEAAEAAAEAAQLAAEAAAASASGVTPVTNRAAMKALDTVSKKTAMIYAEGGRNGTFVFVPDDLSALVAADPLEGIYIAPDSDDTGASGAWVRQGEWAVNGADAQWFGAVADYDGVAGTDHTPVINAALSVPVVNHLVLGVGAYRLGAKVSVPAGKKLSGQGRLVTRVVADNLNAAFDMDATAIVELAPGSPSGAIEDLAIVGVQNTEETVRANLIQYPPALDMSNCPRASVKRLRLVGVIDGIKALGNPGGAFIDEIENGALGCGLEIDGALDFLHIGTIHHWPFDISSTSLYTDIWMDGEVYAAKIGRCDGLDVGSITAYQSIVQMADTGHAISGRNAISRQISRLMLDGSRSSLIHKGRTTQIGCAYITASVGIRPQIDCKGGLLIIDQLHSDAGVGSTRTVSVAGGTALINGGDARNLEPSVPWAQAEGGFLGLSGLRFLPNTSGRSISYVRQTAGVLQVKGCSAPQGDGAAIVSVNSDNVENDVSCNTFPGWLTPPPQPLGNYGPNVSLRRSFTSVLSSTTGTITTPGSVTMTYKVDGDEIELYCTWAITTNGTGAGALQFTLPIAAVGAENYGHGRKTAGGSEESSVRTVVNNALCYVTNSDGTYPGADGAQGRFSLTYRIR